MQYDWLGILPLLILATGGTLLFCAGAFWPRRPREFLFGLAFVTALAAGAAAVLTAPGAPAFAGLELEAYGRYFTLILLGITALTLLFVRRYAQARGLGGDELYALLIFAALGMILAAAASHWLVFFLGLEVLSLSLYVLIAIHKGEPLSNEAGLKYFIMGAVASAFLTFGIALVYAASGTLEIASSLGGAHPQGQPGDLSLILAGLALILVGVAFKVSLVPFHLWTPDVYQGAPAPVTAFLSTGSKVALFAALIRFFAHAAAPVWTYFAPAVWIVAALTMAIGNITAIRQSRVKRLLAYSSVAQMGYLFMTLLAVQEGAMPALLFFLAIYAVMDLGAFGILGTLSGRTPDLDELEDFQGLGYTQPWRAAILATCLISLAGLPPTAGFMGKFVLFKAVLRAGYAVLAVLGIVTVILSIYYYMKVAVALYMRPRGEGPMIPGVDPAIAVAGSVVLILIIWLGLAPSPLLDWLDAAVSGAAGFRRLAAF